MTHSLKMCQTGFLNPKRYLNTIVNSKICVAPGASERTIPRFAGKSALSYRS